MSFLKKHIFSIISFTLVLLTMVFSSAAFSNTYFSLKTSEFAVFDQTCKVHSPDYYYANIDITDKKERYTEEKIFRATYGDNFDGTSTRLITVTGHDGITNFRTLYNDLELPFRTSPVSGLNYSNQKDIPMFETVGINLLVYRAKSDETAFDPNVFDGFIYIPDYYADYIIENTAYIDDYFDILNTNDTNVVYFEYNSRIFKYRIANIFHVKGFKQEYAGDTAIKYTDYNNGLKLDYLLNGFCFVSNYNHFELFDDRFHNTLLLQLGPKRFELEENLNTANNYKIKNEAEDGKATIYYHNKNGVIEYSGSDRISAVIFGPHVGSTNIGYVIAFIGALVIYLALALLSCFEKYKFKNDYRPFVTVFVEVSIYLFLGFFLKKIVRDNIGLALFFNPYAMGVCIGIMIVTFVLMIFSIHVYKKKGKEA